GLAVLSEGGSATAVILHVDVAAQAGIEQYIPAGMMIVVVHVDFVAVPSPVAAARDIVVGDHPGGAVIQDHVARAVVDSYRHILLTNGGIPAVRIAASRFDASALGVPVAIVGIVGIIPAFVLAVIVAIVISIVVPVTMLFLAPVFTVVVAVVVAILRES